MTDLPVSTIDLSRLDWDDETFFIKSFLSSSRLHASLDLYGILQPPWVWLKQDGKFAIVDGVKRLTWARGRERAAERCLVFPAECDPREIMLRRVEGKIFGPTLNVAEKARIIQLLTGILPPEVISNRYFHVLNMSLRPESLHNWCRLAEAEEKVLEAAACERISERSATELMDWEKVARGEAIELFCALRCSGSIQREVLDRITEIAMARGADRLEVMRSPEVRAILDRNDWNHRQKTQGLRDLLARWRFPRLSARENRFNDDLSSISLPKSIHVVHPQAFEGESWKLVLSFSKPQDLSEVLRAATRLALSNDLRKLMYPTDPKQGTKS